MTSRGEPMLAFVKRRLDERKGAWPEVAAKSGVPYQTLTKIACGSVKNPGVVTVQALNDYLVEEPDPVVTSQASMARQ